MTRHHESRSVTFEAIRQRQLFESNRAIVEREMPLRVGTSAFVAILLASLGDQTLAIAWFIVVSPLFALDAWVSRRLLQPGRALTPRDVFILEMIGAPIALVHCLPVIALAARGDVVSVAFAYCIAAGTLIHLVYHHAAIRNMLFAAAAPMALCICAVSVWLSVVHHSIVPACAVGAFFFALAKAYEGEQKTLGKLNDALAQAREQREAAVAADRAKSAFLAAMGHELRTPLNGVIGMAQSLDAEGTDASVRERARVILDSGQALLAQINDILDQSKIEANMIDLSPRETPLASLVARVVSDHEPEARRKGLTLGCDISNLGDDRFRVDPDRLRQCLSHLIANAVKFTETGGIVVTATAAHEQPGHSGSLIEITVRDTGVGFTLEQAHRIFEPFEQADTSVRRRYGGAGLGLSICKRIAEAMGGGVAVSSTPNKGSTFVLWLYAEKLAAAPIVETTPMRNEERLFEGRTILLAEDHDVNRRVVSALLKPYGAKIVEAVNGADAIEKLSADAVDFVLMDLHMPVLDGIAATKEIRKNAAAWSRVPIVALTAACSEQDRRACFEAGMDGFVPKPLKIEALKTAIRDALLTAPAHAAAATA